MIYLDNAATVFPKPEAVYRAMDQFARHYGVNPGRSGYTRCIEANAVVEQTRRLLTDFFNAGSDPDRLCFGHNATDALNLVFAGVLRPGDHVVTTCLEHNSVLRPLHQQSQRNRVEVEHLPCDRRGFIDPGDLAGRLKPNTRLVVVNHASNVIGTVQPIAEIGARCRERGILFVVDASQSAGRVPIDMQAQHIDVVVFTGHKSLCGPTGVGGLYLRPGVEIGLTRAGGTGVRSAIRGHLEEYPYRLEYGTINAVGIAGLQAGVRWVMQQGIAAIHAREMELTTVLRDGLQQIERVRLYCQGDLSDHIGVLLFNVEGMDARQVGELLDVDHDIACRTGLHCAPLAHQVLGTDAHQGGVRFSVGPFNTEQHVAAAIEAVSHVAASGRSGR
ncbi:MAG: aminotransferase class V-fold PLP-dependent enzyme [Deltaproteobacteria bacterium]|nr:aminotransferase class V-fold PLP-dependent enzyme [Deltaproteobacteria bacterium]